ncbi:unnamed protein product [Calypogeia fissa]
MDEHISGLHLHNMAFEDFPPSQKVEERYDLVLLFHSLYYLAPTALKLIFYEYLRADFGSIVVLLASLAGLPALQKSLGVPGPHGLHLEDALEGLKDVRRTSCTQINGWMWKKRLTTPHQHCTSLGS